MVEIDPDLPSGGDTTSGRLVVALKQAPYRDSIKVIVLLLRKQFMENAVALSGRGL